MKWISYPMVRITAVFIAGILLSIYAPDILPIRFWLTTLGGTCFFFLMCTFLFKQKVGVWYGLLGMVSVFVLGYCHLYFFTDCHQRNHLRTVNEAVHAYRALVRSVPEEKAKSWKIELELVDVKTLQWKSVKGKILLYVAKSENPPDWSYGDLLLIRGQPQELSSPSNPGEFDFKRFLGFKNIYHQQFIRPTEVVRLGRGEARGLIYYAHQTRKWSLQKINQFIEGDQERAIASALVLGVTDGVDNDLQNAYSASGAMHVLAVSGLHVGIIYGIILFLLKPIDRFSWSRWLVAVLSLLLLWSFAFVTGLSPSVLRAVMMFSFVAFARPMGWRTNIYNTLAASAFVLLIYNPYLIMSVGFQLSYLAVIGIVYLQRPIYNLLNFDSWLGDWVWRITCVSIAAQVATFSLGLLYFHQFPVYFLVSNLFVIPLSTIILFVGIILLAISFITPVANVIGFALKWIIWLLNWIVFQTESLPFSLISNIHITTLQCWLLMIVLICIVCLFEWKNIAWLYGATSVTIMFAITQWLHFHNDVDQAGWTVYNINGHTAIDFFDRGQTSFIADSTLYADGERIRFHIQPNRLRHGIDKVKMNEIPTSDTLSVKYLVWRGKSIVWVSNKDIVLPQRFYADYLIVSNNSLSMAALEKHSGKRIIFDGSNTKRYIEKVRDKFPNVYATSIEGAFESLD